MNRIFLIIILVCVVLLGAFWYANRSKSHAVKNGEVLVHEPAGDKGKSTADATSTGQSAQPAQAQEPAAGDAASSNGDDADMTPPTADSIRRDPPNGMTFAGKGKYQLYRQGDLTWRLNTDTGDACILFATDAEWRKPKVFQEGCSSH
jgi:hypothetical protein